MRRADLVVGKAYYLARGASWYFRPELGSRVVLRSVPNTPGGDVAVRSVGAAAQFDVNPRLLRGLYDETAEWVKANRDGLITDLNSGNLDLP